MDKAKRTAATMILFVALAGGTVAAGQRSHDWVPDHPPTSLPLRGATGIDWVSTFGSPNADWVNKVLRLPDGTLVAAGFVDRAAGAPAEWDAFAHKLGADGSPIWTKRFGAAGLDAVWSLQQAPGDGLALAGSTEADAAGSTDAWLLLLDGLGEPVAERRFGGAEAEFVFDVVSAAGDGFLIVGETESSGAGERDVFLVRTDASGRPLWERTYGGPRDDRGFYGVAAPGGGFVIAGVTGAPNAYDMLVLKIDDDGNELWRQVIGGEGNDPNHGINLLPDGRIVVAGYTSSWGSSEHDLIGVTLSPDGEILSQELIGGPGDDRVINSVTSADGGTWLIGYTTSFGDGDWDVMLARLSPDGHFEPWLGAIGTAADDHGTTLVETPDGTLVIGGYTSAPSEGREPDLLLLAVDPDSVERRTESVVVRRVR